MREVQDSRKEKVGERFERIEEQTRENRCVVGTKR